MAGISTAKEGKYPNEFALALYGLLRQRPGNLFFSPFSIRVALGMACAGARGETAIQMRQALGFAASDDAQHAALPALIERLREGGGGEYEMGVANSLWSQDGAPLQAGYLDLVARYFAGGIERLDFRRDPESARSLINQWVEHETRKKIQELIPWGAIDADTRLVLANAVYLKAIWEQEFNQLVTRDASFQLEDGRQVSAPLMRQRVWAHHMQAGGYQAVDLAYRGGDVSMLVVLPDSNLRLRDFEETVSASMLESCIAELTWREVELFLPRFKITWSIELGSRLSALGMPLAFSRTQADFSGINGCEPPHAESLFLSAVFHKAFVEVNEMGTEAAAATAEVVFAGASDLEPPPVPIFRADHPFVYAIRDRSSGAILFLGRTADPTLAS